MAAKFEKKDHVSPQLRHEYKVYRELKGSRGICSVSQRTFLGFKLYTLIAVVDDCRHAMQHESDHMTIGERLINMR